MGNFLNFDFFKFSELENKQISRIFSIGKFGTVRPFDIPHYSQFFANSHIFPLL